MLFSRGGVKLLKILYLYYIRRCDDANSAELGTYLCGGAHYSSPPIFPHGIKGIIVSHHAVIGNNVRIFQHVTIGNDEKDITNVPIIEDNVTIYPGAILIGKIRIGQNSKIGANAIVLEDVPPYSLVVAPKAVIMANKYSTI